MRNTQYVGLISSEVVGTNRNLYKSVEDIKAQLNREIEKELRGYRNKKPLVNKADKSKR